LLRRAAALLASGESVLADASWISRWERSAAAEAALQARADLVQLRCVASAELAARRMADRPPGPSDATAEIARQMAAVQAPWPAATIIDTEPTGTTVASAEFDDALEQALQAIRPLGPQHVWRPERPVLLPD
jgi:uncharacterized protein